MKLTQLNTLSNPRQLFIWLFAFLVFACSNSNAQQLHPIWAHAMGGGGADYNWCTKLIEDSKGNLYAIGSFNGHFDFDHDTTNSSLHAARLNGYFTKYDATGRLLWAKKISAGHRSGITDIAIDRSDNVYLVGTYYGTIDFDPSVDTAYSHTAHWSLSKGFVAKYNGKGEFIWGQSIGGKNSNNANTIAIDNKNNVLVGGGFSDTVDFNNGSGVNELIANGHYDPFILKLDSNGTYVWAVNISSSGNESGFGVVKILTDQNNRIYVCGVFSGTTDFDPGVSTTNVESIRNDVFLANYTSNGSYLWATSFGGKYNDYVSDMQITSKSELIVTGAFEDSIGFSNAPKPIILRSHGGVDMYICKFSVHGGFEWAKRIGGKQADVPTSLAIDNFDNYYLTGYFGDSVDFDPSIKTNSLKANNQDAFVAKYTGNADYSWAFKLGGNSRDECRSICIAKNANIWVGGYFINSADFDPGKKKRILRAQDSNIHQSFFARYKQSSGVYDTAFTIQAKIGDRDEIQDFVQDSLGNIYVTGFYTGETNFDPLSNHPSTMGGNESNIFLAKYNSMGYLLWLRDLKSKGPDYASGLCLGDDQSIYLSGVYTTELNLDPFDTSGTIRNNGQQFFLAKYDSDGNYNWGFGLGNEDTGVNQMTIDKDQNIWLTGQFRGTIDFDPGANTSNLNSKFGKTYFAKYDRSGNFKLAKQIGHVDDHCHPADIKFSKDNSIYISGSFEGKCDFDPSSKTYFASTSEDTNYDQFLAKYSLTGELVWANAFQGSGYDQGGQLDFDAHHNVYMLGTFDDSLDSDASAKKSKLICTGKGATSLSSYSPNGRLRWAQAYNSDYRWINGSTIDVDNNIIAISGHFYDEVDFDFSPTSDSILNGGNSSGFILQLDTAGRFKEVAQLNTGLIVPHRVIQSGDNTIVGGWFRGEMDVDPSAKGRQILSSKGYQNDMFIAKFGSKGVCKPKGSLITRQVNCGGYTMPNGKTVHTNGRHVAPLKAKNGCDSFLFVDLKTNNSSSHIFPKACKKYTTPSGTKTYTKSGIYLDTIKNHLGCDSILTIYLSVINPKDSNLKVTACGPYTSPSGKYIYSSSGNYSDTLTILQGCDSVLNITLDIVELDTTISKSQGYLKSNSKSTQYQWLDCDNNYAKIDSATLQYYEYSSSGSYAVEVSRGGCADTSRCVKVLAVKNSAKQDGELNIYPNPTSHFLFIDNQVENSIQYVLFTTSGQFIEKGSFQSSHHRLDLLDLQRGVYVLELVSGTKSKYVRVVKM